MKEWRSKKCKGLIYLCSSKTEKKNYIGLTRRPFDNRIIQHEKDAIAGKGKEGSLQEAIRKYGFNDFDFSIIDRAKNLGELSDKERLYIEKYKSLKPYGYNHNRGGSVATGGIAFEFLGETYLSYADLADHYEIYEETIRKRIHAGWTMRQATELDDPPVVNKDGDHWKFGGYEFISTNELCEHFEIDPGTFKARLKAGWSILQACGAVDRAQNTYLFENNEYNSIKELAEAYNVPYERVSSRLKSGRSLAEAMSPEENPNRFGKKPIEIDGINYLSLSQAAEKLSLSSAKLRTRLQYLNPEKSKAKLVKLKKRTYKKKERNLVIEGKEFESIIELSRHYKVSEGTIRSRLDRGEAIEKAVGLAAEETTFPLEFDGQKFNTQKEIADYFGVKRATFAYRYNKANWSLSESLGLVKRDVEIETVTVDGQEFPSISAVARHFGIQLVTFNGRLGRGWTLEEACNLKSRAKVQANRKVWVVTHPDGKEETVSNLSEFGRKHKLPGIGNLRTTINSSKHHSYRGFTAREATESEISVLLEKDPTALVARTNHKLRHEINYKGKNYRSKRRFCEKIGISYSKFCNQIRQGASTDDAVDYCCNSDNLRLGRPPTRPD